MRVFLTHNPEDCSAYFGRALVELEALVEVVRNPTDHDLSDDELIGAAAGCDAIIAHRSTGGSRSLFERLPDLVAFLRCAVDISTIDVAAASEHGVLVARADRTYVASTAELALGLAIDTARNISESTVDYRAGRLPAQRAGRQLRDQTAGIIGYGSIGSYLAELLTAIGMRVIVHDPMVALAGGTIEQVEFADLLAQSDVVFPLAPANESTKGLIGRAELQAMKRGATLINVSRGELLDESAVADALDSGHLAALGIDVGSADDQRPSLELAARSGVVATPHVGGLTPENADAQAASAVEQVQAILDRRLPPRSVNADHAFRLKQFWDRHEQHQRIEETT